MIEMTMSEFNSAIGSVSKILYDESKEDGIVKETIEGKNIAYVKGIKLIDSEYDIEGIDDYEISQFGTTYHLCKMVLPSERYADLRGIDVSEKKMFKGMFNNYFNYIDITGWNTKNAVNMAAMFRNIYGTLKGYENLNLENVKYINLLFANCSGINHTLDISKWKLLNLEKAEHAFNFDFGYVSYYKNGLKYPQIYMEGLVVEGKNFNAYSMFSIYSFQNTILDLSHFDFTNAKDCYGLLCPSNEYDNYGVTPIKAVKFPPSEKLKKFFRSPSDSYQYGAHLHTLLKIQESIELDRPEDIKVSNWHDELSKVGHPSSGGYYSNIEPVIKEYQETDGFIPYKFRDGSIPIMFSYFSWDSQYKFERQYVEKWYIRDGKLCSLGTVNLDLKDPLYKFLFFVNGELIESWESVKDTLKPNDRVYCYAQPYTKLTLKFFNRPYNNQGSGSVDKRTPIYEITKILPPTSKVCQMLETLDITGTALINKLIKEDGSKILLRSDGEPYEFTEETTYYWHEKYIDFLNNRCSCKSLTVPLHLSNARRIYIYLDGKKSEYLVDNYVFEDTTWKEVLNACQSVVSGAQIKFDKPIDLEEKIEKAPNTSLYVDPEWANNVIPTTILRFTTKSVNYNGEKVPLTTSSELKDVIPLLEPDLKFEDVEVVLILPDGTVIENPEAAYNLQGTETVKIIDGKAVVNYLKKIVNLKDEVLEEEILSTETFEEKKTLRDLFDVEGNFEFPEYVESVEAIRKIYINGKVIEDLDTDIHKDDVVNIVYICKNPEGTCMINFIEKINTPEGEIENYLVKDEEVGELKTLPEILAKESTFEFPSYIEDISTIRKIYINGNEVTDLDTDIIKDDVIEIVYSYQNYHEEERECKVDKVIICADQGECRFKFKIKDIDFDKVPWGQSIDCICDNGWGKFNINPWMHNGDGFQGYLGNPDGQGNCVMSIWAGEPWTMELSLKDGGEFGFEFEEIVNAKLLTANKETVKVLN